MRLEQNNSTNCFALMRYNNGFSFKSLAVNGTENSTEAIAPFALEHLLQAQ